MASPSPTPRAAVPPARAFGAKDTQAHPTSRGWACFVSVLMGQRCGQTATGPRAGGGSAAGQSLWRRADAPMPHEQGGGSAAGQSLRREGHASPPHEQGVGLLRFGSDGAAVRADGDRPMSRGLSPAAVFFGGSGGRERKWTADMLRRPKRIIPQVPFAVAFSPAAQAGRRPAAVCCLPRAIRDRGHGIHGNRPGILF